MGTNFYAERDAKPACECCGRPYIEDRRHIGKSSFGWCFSLHVIPEDGINTLEDWVREWSMPGVHIVDEYGDVLTAKQMLSRVTERSGAAPNWNAREYAINHAQPGPKNLIRHLVDGMHCIGHGDGTWDYIRGEFS